MRKRIESAIARVYGRGFENGNRTSIDLSYGAGASPLIAITLRFTSKRSVFWDLGIMRFRECERVDQRYSAGICRVAQFIMLYLPYTCVPVMFPSLENLNCAELLEGMNTLQRVQR